MEPKSYHIPSQFKDYDRTPRPYTPRAPSPQRPPPRPKGDWRKPVMPVVSKLKPLNRYAPATPVARLPQRAPSKINISAPPRAQPHSPTQVLSAHALDQRRRQAENYAEQQRIQNKHRDEQERVQQVYAAQQQSAANQRERRQADQKRVDQRRSDNTDAQQRRRETGSGTQYPQVEPAEAEDAPPKVLPLHGQTPHRQPPRTREETKAEIRRQLLKHSGRPAEADEQDEAPEDTEKKKNKGSSWVFYIIVAVIIYFSCCNGCFGKSSKSSNPNGTNSRPDSKF